VASEFYAVSRLPYPVCRQISLGSIHNVVQRAVDKARELNRAEDLSAIRVGAHDEIYQAGRPVLAGMDVASTYCQLPYSDTVLNPCQLLLPNSRF